MEGEDIEKETGLVSGLSLGRWEGIASVEYVTKSM